MLSAALERAMRREMAYPPPPEPLAPLPDAASSGEEVKTPKGEKGS